jgi:hypothetical protein
MIYIYLFCIGLSGFILSSCSHKHTSSCYESSKQLTNHLVQNTVEVGYEYQLYVPQDYWFLKGIDGAWFMRNVYAKSANNELNMFYPVSQQTYPLEQAQLYFSQQADGLYYIPIDEITDIVFTESWIVDTAVFKMEKYVTDYSLVRKQIKKEADGSSETVKTLVATYRFPKQAIPPISKLVLLGTDITYEVPFDNPIVEGWIENIPVKHAVKVIVDKILQGNIPVYSFMVRDTLVELTPQEVRERLGEVTYTGEFFDEKTGEEEITEHTVPIDYSEIKGFAFIEDWYVDTTTMAVYKIVKGIAPVREYAKMLDSESYEMVRTIPCMVFFF